jgi:hypothetical protein
VSVLAARYRVLLLAYPRAYRRQRGEEILGTCLEAASGDQAWPSPGDAFDLLRHGSRERLRLSFDHRPAQLLRMVAVPAMAMSASFALVAVVFGELPVWGSDPGLNANQFGYGPFETTGVWAYAFALAATLALVAGRTRASRRLAALVCVAVAVSFLLAGPNVWGRPNATLLVVLVIGLLPLLVLDPDDVRVTRPGRRVLLALPVLATALALPVFGSLPTGHPDHPDPRNVFYSGPRGLIDLLHTIAPEFASVMLVVLGLLAWGTGRRLWWLSAHAVLVPATVIAYGGGRPAYDAFGGEPDRLARYAGNSAFEALVVVVAVVVAIDVVLVGRGWTRSRRPDVVGERE